MKDKKGSNTSSSSLDVLPSVERDDEFCTSLYDTLVDIQYFKPPYMKRKRKRSDSVL